MVRWGDDRAQSIQVGAVLLFAVLVVAFTSYQAFVVPQQNYAVEFSHSQQVQGDLLQFRNAVVSAAGSTNTRAVAVELGTQYPVRAIATNPGPPTGQLRTAGTDDPAVSMGVENAVADGETGDVWNGTRRTYGTGSVVYEANYNEYRSAPTTVYEHTVLAEQFADGTIVKANQTLVDGRTISLVTLDGSIARTGTGTASVDVHPVSSAQRTVLVEAESASEPVTVTFASRLPADRWRTILSDEDRVASVAGDPSAAPDPYSEITVTFETGHTYRLQMTKVGVGTGATGEPAVYLTDVQGEGTTLARGQSEQITVEVRDAYNNPVSGVTVEASAGPNHGSVADGTKSTGADGRATFTYQTAAGTELGTHRVNLTTADAGTLSARPFDQSTAENVSVNVTVQESGGGTSPGSYGVAWEDPSTLAANSGDSLSSCSADACTWDVGASSDDELRLNGTTSPPFDGVEMDFAVSNATVGTVSPGTGTTGADGAARTTLTGRASGTVEVLTAADGGSDVITVTVENVTGGATGPPTTQNGIRYDGGLTTTASSSAVQFDITNVDTSSAEVESVSVTARNGVEDRIFNNNPSEIDISGGDTDGYHDVDGNPSANALTADGTSIDLDQNAVLSTSGSGTSATVFVGNFGSPSGNTFSQYDFTGLDRVTASDNWDVSITLGFQNRGDVTYYFAER